MTSSRKHLFVFLSMTLLWLTINTVHANEDKPATPTRNEHEEGSYSNHNPFTQPVKTHNKSEETSTMERFSKPTLNVPETNAAENNKLQNQKNLIPLNLVKPSATEEISAPLIMQEQIKIIESMIQQTHKLEAIIEDVNRWEQNLSTSPSRDAIDRIKSFAEKFSVERQTRKKISKESQKMVSLFDEFLEKNSNTNLKLNNLD